MCTADPNKQLTQSGSVCLSLSLLCQSVSALIVCLSVCLLVETLLFLPALHVLLLFSYTLRLEPVVLLQDSFIITRFNYLTICFNGLLQTVQFVSVCLMP